ncbi:uncharacterized protein (TIGR02687 family) [Psychrobacter sp. PL15]|uniref:BREX-1 system phosphatase PglZ type A n=1 Tax=Psychrobacter sp. PL15 TaxID=3071719 RepID=UPI002E04CB8B|nr:uncharacterized protein (TIGR02687 family) [Psychrobacter sp. PL15]
MQINELIEGIKSKLEQSRIVFWHDPEHSFQEDIDQITASLSGSDSDKLKDTNILPDSITVLNMADESVLAVKKRIEIDEPQQSFLLYFSEAEPTPESDWLLDIRLYSEPFFADRSSMLLNELSIPKMSLREHIRQRNAFFGSKKRTASLKKWVSENEDELSLDRKMMAVVVNADSAELDSIILSLLNEYANNIDSDIGETPLWDSLVKFGLDSSFWSYLETAFGYITQEPSLTDFTLKLFCTDFWRHIESIDRNWLSNNVLKTASGQSNAMAFMSSWRDSRTYAVSYENISGLLASKLEIKDKSVSCSPMQLLECQTFEEVEQNIIVGLVDDLIDESRTIDSAHFDSIISRRLLSHWTKSKEDYKFIYNAIGNAKVLMQLRNDYIDGFHFGSAKEMYAAYTERLFKFDQAYRLFSENVNYTFSKGSEILRKLNGAIENLYVNWYLRQLGLSWDKHLEDEKLLDSWKIKDIPNQYDFYNKQVQSLLSGTQIKRVFVVISDALRYEVANELDSIINSEKRFKSEISTQLGVLPSYTQLGMASLLPHKTLGYNDKGNSAVYVDGFSSQGLDNRNKILQKVGGIAVKSTELMNWNNEEGRDKVRDAKVVYIYHDTIDATGDNPSNEHKTFKACRDAINELKDLVSRIINRLNGSRVIITADHGFLFQNNKLTGSDKTAFDVKELNTIEAKKRYVIGYGLPSDSTRWKGLLSNTANGETDLEPEVEFILPKSSQRFHFSGGAQFVHGGAMLQEICVPVIQVRELQKEQVAKYEKRAVGIISEKQSIKLVNNIDKITFIQTDIIDSEFIPRKLEIFIVDSEGMLVSSKETIVFDSSSENMNERKRDATFKLIGSSFDRNSKYTLILQDSETNTEYQRYSVTIDLAFHDEFF